MNSGSGSDNLSMWVEQMGRPSLCVVSPHFDDAIFSSFTVLTHPWFSRKVVATVVTRAPVGKKTYWATLTGFEDAQQEHLERGNEDRRVLAAIGVEACHLGGEFENTPSMVEAVDRLVRQVLVRPESWVVLLPAAAGRAFTLLDELAIRMGRSRESLLNGAIQQHPDHLRVRDATSRALKSVPMSEWGYYAENPYLTADPIESLQRRAEGAAGHGLRRLEAATASKEKLASIEGYASQLTAILGAGYAERMKFASRKEVYFVPCRRAYSE
jgi:hypothetical protein